MRPTRTKARRLTATARRARTDRRRMVAAGLLLGLGGAATFALSMLAIVADPYAMDVGALGSVALIGASASVLGLFVATAEV